MRRPSPAGITLALAAISASLVGCSDARSETAAPHSRAVAPAAGTTAPGAELMTQEAPRVQRPFVDREYVMTPRMAPGETPGRYPFYWTRAIYSSYGGGGGYGYGRGWGTSWDTDFPKGDQQFLIVLKRLVRLNAYDWENPVSLADPELRRFPVVYAVEVGRMDLTEDEVEGLRNYLDAGGFLIVDDFWGTREWDAFEYNIRRVLPDNPIVELSLDHELFSTYYDIEEVKQVPNIGNARRGWQTWENGGRVPHVRGIFDDDGRLMVVINFNTDLGDAWEWAEDPWYPLEYSTFAYELGANMIVYAMSH